MLFSGGWSLNLIVPTACVQTHLFDNKQFSWSEVFLGSDFNNGKSLFLLTLFRRMLKKFFCYNVAIMT